MQKSFMVRLFQILTGLSASVVLLNGRALAKAKEEKKLPAIKVVNLALGCVALGLNMVNLFRENEKAKQRSLNE